MKAAWTPCQQREIDCIACDAGIPARPLRYFSAEHVVVLPRPRFNTRRLASKLSQTLRTRAA